MQEGRRRTPPSPARPGVPATAGAAGRPRCRLHRGGRHRQAPCGARTRGAKSSSRGTGAPLFQSAAANLNPWTQAKVDSENPERGPLLIVSGEKDNTVPWAIANASYKRQKRNEGVTEIVEIPNRGHALTIDSGWREVADKALGFVQRFASAHPAVKE